MDGCQTGRSALHIACWYNKEAAAAALLATPGLPVNQPDLHGNTPLMMAAKYGTRGVMLVMLDCAAVDLDAVDNMGRGVSQMLRESWRMSAEEKLEMEEIFSTEKRRRSRESALSAERENVSDDEVNVITDMKDEVLTRVEQFSAALDAEQQECRERQQSELAGVLGRQEEEMAVLVTRHEQEQAELRARARLQETEQRTRQLQEAYQQRARHGRETEEVRGRQAGERAGRAGAGRARLAGLVSQLDTSGSDTEVVVDTARTTLLREAECPVCLQETVTNIVGRPNNRQCS